MNHVSPGRPLVTFAVLTYRQERFVAEAVRGALSQTYTPLEVIFSDDASDDRTFEIIQEQVASYQGPHTIVLNRNEQNLGMARHVNKVFALAQGEILLTAAGDDVSLPSRTEVTVEAFEDPGVWGAAALATIIDEDGHPTVALDQDANLNRPTRLIQIAEGMGGGLHGCSAAYRTSLVGDFGPLIPECAYEDYALSFRALLRGNVKVVPVRCVMYRQHQGAVCNYGTVRGTFRERERRANRHRAALAGASRDNLKSLRLAAPSPGLPEPFWAELEQTLERALAEQSYFVGLAGATRSNRLKHLLSDLFAREHWNRVRWHLRCLLSGC